MLLPLPQEFDEALTELSECGKYVADNQYADAERQNMVKLEALGLVARGWVLTPAGNQRLNALLEEEISRADAADAE